MENRERPSNSLDLSTPLVATNEAMEEFRNLAQHL